MGFVFLFISAAQFVFLFPFSLCFIVLMWLLNYTKQKNKGRNVGRRKETRDESMKVRLRQEIDLEKEERRKTDMNELKKEGRKVKWKRD